MTGEPHNRWRGRVVVGVLVAFALIRAFEWYVGTGPRMP